MMRMRVACLFGLGSVVAAAAQEPLADGVTQFLGGGPAAAFFVKDGAVWVTDGTAPGTRPTCAPAGQAGDVVGGRLVVYGPQRIDWLSADGATTVLAPPIAFAGFDADAPCPTVWRPLLATPYAEYLEVFAWRGGSWTRTVSGVQVVPPHGSILDRRARHGRYLVVAEENGLPEVLVDLLPADPPGLWYLTDLDSVDPDPRPWSAGVAYRRAGYGFVHGVAAIPDRGAGVALELPGDWPFMAWSVLETTPGFPYVRRSDGTELVTFLTADTARLPAPPGTVRSLCWGPTAETVYAAVDAAGARAALWLDRANAVWRTIPGLGAAHALRPLGAHAGVDVLAVDGATGVAVVAFDPATATATPLVAGLAGVGDDLAALGDGFAFAADDGSVGSELWYSDGTASGTRLAADLAAGAAGSSPAAFTPVGERLVFTAVDGTATRLFAFHAQQLGWTRDPHDGRFYRRTAPTTWTAAEREARNLGGTLATVRDQRAQDWLWATFGPGDLWIGLEDRDRDGVFRWVGGAPVTFTAWCAGEPSGGPDETAVHMTQRPLLCDGGWNDTAAAAVFPALVERATAPQPVEAFGAGCRREPGQPVAAAVWTGGWPRPGGAVDLRFELGTGYALHAAVLLGFDATRLGGLDLPIDLGFVGAPGCALAIAVDDLVALGEVFYEARWTLAVPNDRVLCGARLFVQALAYTPWGGPEATTDALRITVVQ